MRLGLFALALVLALPGGSALADLKPGEKEEKGPKEQGFGKDGQEQQEGPKNPLPGIVELMKEVERRIAEIDTGTWTQEEQERIVKALDLERGVIEALKKLIEEVESRPPEGSGGGAGGDPQGPPRSGSRKGDRQKQMSERKQEGQQTPVDPQGQKQDQQKQDQQKGERERSEQQARNDRKAEGEPPAAEYQLERSRAGAPGVPWGNLPPKQAREAMEAARREPPVQWRKQIEDDYKKLAEPQT